MHMLISPWVVVIEPKIMLQKLFLPVIQGPEYEHSLVPHGSDVIGAGALVLGVLQYFKNTIHKKRIRTILEHKKYFNFDNVIECH